MFKFLKWKKNEEQSLPTTEVKKVPESSELSAVDAATPSMPSATNTGAEAEKSRLFSRLKQGLQKTRNQFTTGLGNLFLGKKIIDQALLEQIEEQLLIADVGVEASQEIIENLTEKVSRKQLNDVDTLLLTLQGNLKSLLFPCEKLLVVNNDKKPFVILVVGVNGVGKTTTIGKLAKRLQQEDKKVILAAADTFRAAAIEQLQIWGERNQIPVIAQQQGADSASVAFDALQAARARNSDVLIIDTAGRLHTQTNLMQELQKVKRVLGKIDTTAPHEVLLILDAGNGQNALNQAKQFQQAVQVTGIALTKLDGTAKGGIIFSIAKNLGIPIRFIGVGEKIDDLRVFQANDFVSALFAGGE